MLSTCNDIGFSLNRNQTFDVVQSYLKETEQTPLSKKITTINFFFSESNTRTWGGWLL